MMPTRASRLPTRSPYPVTPSIRFLSIGSPFMLHAFFPYSVVQLRFTSFAMIYLRRDFHPQERAQTVGIPDIRRLMGVLPPVFRLLYPIFRSPFPCLTSTT
jgi:hypothetical protein